MEEYRSLWAKTSDISPEWHPLLCHLIDAGQVCSVLWEDCFSPATHHIFAHTLKLDEESTGRLLSFWVSLHDIGKAAPGFQRKHEPAVPILEAAGFSFPIPSSNPAPHGVVSAWALESILEKQCGMSLPAARRIARALGGHHGSWPTSTQLMPQSLKAADRGDAAWDAARRDMVETLKRVFQPPLDFSWPESQEDENTLLTLFSGMTTIADWMGSMSEFFTFQTEPFEPNSYAKEALQKARQAVKTLGWGGWQAEGCLMAFEQMFPFQPNPVQEMVVAAGKDLEQPALLILEAPTGSGKTEAALFLADTWLQSNRGQGIYIAMPTQATSNQMFSRVSQFLLHRYPGDHLNLHLVHGAQLLAHARSAPLNVSDNESQPLEGGIRAEAWFLPRKRTLLAPFGVGTVDQALMSVLQTRHFFVRMFGLGQKVIVFDEIHAYDTYMSELFQHLLRWLRGIGTSVILLSATLPQATRRALMAAWGNAELPDTMHPYPRLTVVTPSQSRTVSLPWEQTRTIPYEWIPCDPDAIAGVLKEKLQDGGCAAVICNRVARAREVYQAIERACIVPAEDLILFHARFPYARRAQIEEDVLKRFTKGGERPRCSIVVATQVIEQSLDLDFDLMITDLAPIDLLLQRAGRLHRHSQNDPTRPIGLQNPWLAIVSPAQEGPVPGFGADEKVYEASILLRSWAVLQPRSSLSLPLETDDLIEAVYGEENNATLPAVLVDAIQQAQKKALETHQQEIFEARIRMIPGLEDERLLFSQNGGLEEDDPTVHKAYRALTRLGEPGVNLVCLYQTADGLVVEPGGQAVLASMDEMPDLSQTQQLLSASVSVQHQEIYAYFSRQEPPGTWRTIAALRYHHPVVFDSAGRARLAGSPWILILDQQLGLLIQKEVDECIRSI